MTDAVLVIGVEQDPAKRLRKVQAEKIRDMRKLRGHTLRGLAALMSSQEGISVTAAAISEWERGVSSPRQHMQVALAKALNTSWGSLFSLEGQS